MNIPKNIKIGCFNYHVERIKGPFVSDGTALDGEHRFAEKTIRVSDNGCGYYQDVVFLHEVCHAIIAHYCADEQDEKFVEQFSKGLYQVINDNPELLKVGAADG